MEMVQKGGTWKVEFLTNKNHQEKIGQIALEVIELESSSQFLCEVN